MPISLCAHCHNDFEGPHGARACNRCIAFGLTTAQAPVLGTGLFAGTHMPQGGGLFGTPSVPQASLFQPNGPQDQAHVRVPGAGLFGGSRMPEGGGLFGTLNVPQASLFQPNEPHAPAHVPESRSLFDPIDSQRRAVIEQLDQIPLLRGMGPLMLTKVEAKVDPDEEHHPARRAAIATAQAETALQVGTFRRLQESIYQTPEGVRMLSDMAHLQPLLDLDDVAGVPEWQQRAVALAKVMAKTQHIYVRNHIVIADLPLGEEYWAPLLPHLIRHVDELLLYLSPRTVDRFPRLRQNAQRWRLAAVGNFHDLLALPEI